MEYNFDSIQSLLSNFNHYLTFFLIFPLIVVLGLYLTVRLGFIQLSKLKMSFKYLLKKDEKCEGNISRYQAISAVLAGNFGTGNISGMAIALTTGGPGALIWMWVVAFLGASIQYVSCILGVQYRQKNGDGEYVGGPMYYLKYGLGLKKLGVLFALFTVFAALTVGNFAQINSVILPLEKMGLSPIFSGIVIAFFVGLVILGGIQRVSRFASFIVPFKALLYLLTSLIILILHADQVWPALQLMVKSAFNVQSVTGGMLGFGMVKALTTGFDRGIFATDAGTGIIPILQASARTTNPIIDGVVTLVAPFLVMIVCTMTGLVLIVTGAWEHLELRSTNMVTLAFQQGLNHSLGAYIVIFALVLFAYTTILAWACCGEKAIYFLSNQRYARYFKYFYIVSIPIGAVLHVDLIWILADISISFMLLTNMIGVTCLSGWVIKESKAFFLKNPDVQLVEAN